MQNKIIFFSWAYLAGIVVSMTFQPDAANLGSLRLFTTLLLILLFAAAAFQKISKLDSALLKKLGGFLLLAAPLLLGVTRHTSSNSVPDSVFANVSVQNGAAQIQVRQPLKSTSRIRVVLAEPTEEALSLQLKGTLRARIPIEENGIPQMNADGQWRFEEYLLDQESPLVEIPAGSPAGTEIIINEPFSTVDEVEVTGAAKAKLKLLRISNHISSFVRDSRYSTPVRVLGRIEQDPMIYSFKTVLTITPYFLQYRKGGHCYTIEGGDIRVTLGDRTSNYDDFAQTAAYGYDIVVDGALFAATPATNPGGFDPRKFMANHNIFGQISPRQARGEPSPIQYVGPGGGDPRKGNALVEFSLDARDSILSVFKYTMPYPHSAFLSAVTLGLRYGLANVHGPYGPKPVGEVLPPDTPKTDSRIVDDFRYAGVNHVLAVSGLHVTIITAMMLGIFSLFRIPRTVYAPAIILILVIFAIITGARPSTLRAVIMNSLFILTWAYLAQSLRSSVLFGIPVAAFLILLHNPLMIVDPSFTLSFGAILSLALLTGPFYEMLGRLKGNSLAVTAIGFFVLSGFIMYRWSLLLNPWFLLGGAAVFTLILKAARKLEDKGIKLIGNYAFTDIPSGIGVFLGAQIGIQVGMMLPLSAYYFASWPFAGAYLNLVAIPLIGVVVQVGVLAGLIGLIPIIGPFLALILNGSNYLFTSIFLYLAHIGTEFWPYPFVRRPSLAELITYYILCAMFIWHHQTWHYIKGFCDKRKWTSPKAPFLLASACIILALMPVILFPRAKPQEGLNITMFSVGYGRSILIESPAGKRIMVDAGHVQHDRGRRNEAERSILPYLARRGIRDLDLFILTSMNQEEAAGVPYILAHCSVDELALPAGMEKLADPGLEYGEFADLAASISGTEDDELLRRSYHDWVTDPMWPNRPSITKALHEREPGIINSWANWVTPVTTYQAGTVLFSENTDGKTFTIEAIGPKTEGPGTLRITHGEFSMLIAGDLPLSHQASLVANTTAEKLRADVCVAPHHGTAAAEGLGMYNAGTAIANALNQYWKPLLQGIQPEYVLIDYAYPGPVLKRRARDADTAFRSFLAYTRGRVGADRCLVTGRDLAIFLHSDGENYTVESQAQRVGLTGEDGGAVSAIEVGF